ncbi:MAG: YebC/PmpR family DNA-binding transcriptional regulator [Cytophagales bacterium]|nr:YebC/PmpR family DNA-binding transcriptional regulator [Cytophagales bacterium]MDW8384678.1 YebC/PmpR family DNA-binding transcriptional regulator [Flammeovirgaceae bacterium]
MGRAFEYRKERKFKRWGQMSRTFTKIGREIAMAVKAGGPNPESNLRLRVAIQNARAANMPKENIERAIKRATTKEQEDYKEMVYEGYAPHGIAVIIDCATDNPNRTVANLRSYFNKTGGSLGVSGSVAFMFDRKSVIRISQNAVKDVEEFELEMIDYGVEEVMIDHEEQQLVIYAPFENFGDVTRALENKGIEIIKSEFERIPNVTKELTPEQEEDVHKLFEKLEEDDDVQNYFSTLA